MLLQIVREDNCCSLYDALYYDKNMCKFEVNRRNNKRIGSILNMFELCKFAQLKHEL